MEKHLKKNGELLIMKQTNNNGTRDFILIDHENASFYIGTSASTPIDPSTIEKSYKVSRKSELNIERKRLSARGYIEKNIHYI